MLRIEHVDAREWMRPMGATPFLSLVPDGPQDTGTDAAQEEVSDEVQRAQDDARWGAAWFAHYLGHGDAA